VASATPDWWSRVAEATPMAPRGGSATPKGQNNFEIFLGVALGGGQTTPYGHGVASATSRDRLGVDEQPPMAKPPPMAMGVVRPPSMAKPKKNPKFVFWPGHEVASATPDRPI
jgi:hypothetical protein